MPINTWKRTNKVRINNDVVILNILVKMLKLVYCDYYLAFDIILNH